MNQDLISVIVPIYNVEQYLERCVNSICNQTYKNLEIILVDDESPDNCGKMCDEFALKDSRVKVIHQKNKGLSGARNSGIDIAKGEYIGFVDSDDYIDETMYETLYNDIKKFNAKISICNRFYEFEDGKRLLRYKVDNEIKVYTGKEAIIEMNSFSSFDMSAWDKLYHRSVWEKIRYPEGKLSEDFFVIFKLFDIAQKVTFNPKPLYFYFQRKNSISRNKKINWDFIEASKEQMEYVSEKYPDITDVVKIAYASANMTVYNFHIKSKVKCPKDKRKEMQKNVKNNLACFSKENVPRSKKIQAFLFCKCTVLYNVMFKILRRIKEI